MVTRLEKFCLAQASVLFALGVLLSIVNRAHFEQDFIREDGILEWLTVLALGSAAAVMAGRLWRYRADASIRQRLAWCAILVLFTFGAGEEISWGQRLFAFGTPDFLREWNAQEETNIHNLVIGGVKINKLVFGNMVFLVFCLYVFVVTPLYHRVDRARAWLDAWAVPIPQRYQWAGYLTVFLVVEVLVNLASDTPKRGELTEFGMSVLVALTVVFPFNRAAREPLSSSATTATSALANNQGAEDGPTSASS